MHRKKIGRKSMKLLPILMKFWDTYVLLDFFFPEFFIINKNAF